MRSALIYTHLRSWRNPVFSSVGRSYNNDEAISKLATLGPAGKIDDFVRAMCCDGVVAPKHWRSDDDLIDVDKKELAHAIARVVGDEVAGQTRAALNQLMGRLD